MRLFTSGLLIGLLARVAVFSASATGLAFEASGDRATSNVTLLPRSPRVSSAFILAPILTAVAPNPGGLGQSITLTGTNLDSPTALSINGANALANIISNSGTSLVVRVPVTAAATGTVSITTASGTGTLAFTVMPAPGNALALDGADDYVVLPSGLNTASFTFEAWVNYQSNGDWTRIFDFGTTTNNWMLLGPKAGVGYTAGAVGNIFFSLKQAGVSDQTIFTSTPMPAGRWHHLAVTLATAGAVTSGTIYLDGVAIGTNPNMSLNPTVLGTLTYSWLGRSRNGDPYLKASMDEVRIWNTARTAAEVQADMAAPATAPFPAALRFYLNMDQGTPATATAGNNVGLITLYDLTAATPAALTNFALTSGNTTSNYVESYAAVAPTATAATAIGSAGFTANWTAPAIGTVDNGYRLDVATDAAFTTLVSGSPFTVSSGLSQAVTGLAASTTYYYRVRADKNSVTGQGDNSNTITVTTLPPLPVITGIAPITGAAGTTGVIITGTNLSGATAVSVNGAAATITANTVTSITFTVPAGASTSQSITVTTPSGTSAAYTGFTVQLKVVAASPTSPLPNASAAPVAGSAVAVGFTEAVTSASATNVAVFGGLAGGKKAGTVTGGGTSTLSFAATASTSVTNFRPGEVVSVTVPNTVQTATGLAAGPFVYQFTTGGLNSSTGTFNDRLDVTLSGRDPRHVRWADIDGDGKPDLLVANKNTSTFSVNRNLSTVSSPAFGAASFFLITPGPSFPSYEPYSAAAGDADGDGKPDVATANRRQGSVSVCRNTSISGTVSFASFVEWTVGGTPQEVQWADLDGDGKLDLVTVNNSTNTMSVLRNTSTGTGSISFDAALSFALSGSGSGSDNLRAADLDGDGKLDLVLNNASSTAMRVMRNNSTPGTMSFVAEADVPLQGGSTPYGPALADVDGDGKPDILAVGTNQPNAYVVRNTSTPGSISFAGYAQFAVGAGSGYLTAADLNGDGKPDLATVGSAVKVLLNTSTGPGNVSFGATSTYPLSPGSGGAGIMVADADGDGSLDLAVANSSTSSLSVFLNTPNAPTITSFNPTSGPVGTTISLTGTNLTGATAITFSGSSGNVVTTGFTVASATSITGVVVPAGAITGTLTVTTPIGTNLAASPVFTATPSLSNLVLSAGTLTPAFVGSTSSYTLSTTSASTTVTPTNAQTAGGTITVNGTAVTSGSASGAVALTPGSNTITVVVNPAGAGTAITYTVTVTRTCAVTALAQNVSVTLAANGTATVAAAAVDNGSASTCGTITLAVSPNTFTCTDAVPATVASSLSFSGNNQYLTLPTTATLPTGNSPYTIEAWIKPTKMDAYGIIGYGAYNTNNQVNAFRLTPTGLVHYWWAKDLSVTTGNLADGLWHHVAVTYDGTTRTIYVDGVMPAGGSDVPGVAHAVPNANNVTIAKTYNAEYFSGGMDEVRVWNVARTAAQVNAAKGVGLPGTTAGLVAYYRFNEGSGTTAADATGTAANLGTFVGTPTWSSSAPTVTNGSPVTLTVTDSFGGSATASATVTILDTTPPVFASNGAGTSASPFTNLNGARGVATGTYWFRFGANTFQGYVDGTTDGGGWVGIMNYVHQGGTNPALNARTTNLPLPTSAVLGADESTVTTAWGHAAPALVNSLNPLEVRFTGQTSGHGRMLDFKTSLASVLTYFKTGTGNTNDLGPVGTFTALLGHTATLPASRDNGVANQGSSALTEFPFMKNNANYWAVRGYSQRWEMDDFSAYQTVPTDGYARSTIHRAYARGSAMAAPGNNVTATAPAGQCGATVVLTGTQPVSDNCAGTTITFSPASGSFFAVGTTAVTATATDASGNTATSSFTVTVTESQPPTAVAQNVGVTLNADGTASITAAQINNGSSDNCTATANLTLSVSPSTFTCANVGNNAVTLSVTDASGNTSTAAAVVTVSVPATPTTTWNGASSTSWTDCGNWSYGKVPDAFTNVVIPTGLNRYPNLNAGTLTVQDLTIATGASFTLSTAGLQVYGHWTNNGTASLTGPVNFRGGANQTLGGSSLTTFSTLTVDKPASVTLTLQRATTITTVLNMTTNGLLVTGPYELTTTGATLNERENSYVLGNVLSMASLTTAGTRYAFGNLGLALTPALGSTALPGATTVRRTTGTALTGVGTSQSIRRNFDIQPAVNTGLNVTLEFGYFTHELNGIAPANLALFKSVTTTAGPWIPQRPVTLGANVVTKTGVTDFSIWTLGSSANPLPVELNGFTATAQGPTAVRLAWATASEKNSARFEAERSPDGRTFVRLGTVAAAGSSSTPRNYELLDAKLPADAATLYYRLRQVDLDGTFTYSPVRMVALTGSAAAGLALYPNPAHGGIATLTGAVPGTLVVVFDALGREVTSAPADATGTTVLALPAGMPTGVYIVRAGNKALRLTVE